MEVIHFNFKKVVTSREREGGFNSVMFIYIELKGSEANTRKL